MADITTNKSTWQYTFKLSREGEDSVERTLSVDNPLGGAEGLSAAKAFRDVFSGAASSPFSIIDPRTFIQPAGWRDSNEDEPPWTTTACKLKLIEETTIAYDGGDGGGGDGREVTFIPASDELDFRVSGLSASTGTINYISASITPEGGTPLAVNRSNIAIDVGSNLFRITDALAVSEGSIVNVFIASDSDYAATVATYTV